MKQIKGLRREAKRSAKLHRMPKDGKVSTGVAKAQSTRVPQVILRATICHSLLCNGELRVPRKNGRCPVCRSRLVAKK